MSEDFNAYTCALDGNHLVEAGAGTGKTYNIQILFLRLLLQGIPITKILVVTFTELATTELRERLRKILSEMLDACFQFQKNNTFRPQNIQLLPFFNSDYKLDSITPEDVAQKISLLKMAQQSFDDAPISTIHGFCSRMLNENAFESGLRYGMKPRSSVSDLVFKALNDFCRKECYTEGISPEVRAVLTAIDCRPDALHKALKPLLSGGGATPNWNGGKYIWENATQDIIDNRRIELESQIDVFDNLIGFQSLADMIEGGELTNVGTPTNAGIAFLGNGNLAILDELFRIRHPEAVRRILNALGGNWFRKSKKSEETIKKIKATQIMRDAENFKEVVNEYSQLIKKLAYDYVTESIRGFKSRDAFMTFDDILTELDKRLQQKPQGDALANVIRDKFKGAIVDEFQDTDQIQYNIFNKLFAESNNHFLFMIGDPKQAIYMFRGGDIFTYLKAKEAIPMENRHTLSVNYRSSDSYIDAMNTFFGFVKTSQNNDFFNVGAVKGCDFGGVAIGKPNGNKHIAEGMGHVPLLSGAMNDKGYFGHLAEEIQWIINESKWMLYHDKSKKTAPVGYGDIAVLVRSGKDGQEAEKALSALQIPCVQYGDTNIFSTSEAEALRPLLEALLEPGSQPLALAFLMNRMMGLTAKEMELVRDRHLPDFQLFLASLASLWERSSFLAMFNTLMKTSLQEMFPAWIPDCPEQEELLKQPLLARIGGQMAGSRAIAIYNQLGDILHQIAVERSLGPSGLLAFLVKQLNSATQKKNAYGSDDSETNTADAEDKQEEEDNRYALRVPTQDDSVSIMTIHKSKGLEFPIVFVPRLKMEANVQNKPTIYHEEEGNEKWTRRVRMSKEQENACNREQEAENRRLLYVAITRAKYLCRFMEIPAAKDDSGAKPNKGRKKDTVEEDTKNTVNSVWKNLTVVDSLADYSTKASSLSAETPTNTENDEHASESEKPINETFHTTELERGWKTCSYTALTVHRVSTTEKDDDANRDVDSDDAQAPVPWKERAPIFRFAAGAEAGIAWHAFFEKLDFQSTDNNELLDIARNHLKLYFPSGESDDDKRQMLDAFLDMTRGVLFNPLPTVDFKLSEIPPQDRLHELRFSYRLRDGFASNALRTAFVNAGCALPDDWSPSCKGMDWIMTGAIDLLFRHDGQFFILDWKTNIIGANMDNFHPDGLQAEMARNSYTLQYLIYVVAFMNFYKSLQPATFQWNAAEYDKLFGGVFYVFLRGVSEKHEQQDHDRRGVFFAKPPFHDILPLYSMLSLA